MACSCHEILEKRRYDSRNSFASKHIPTASVSRPTTGATTSTDLKTRHHTSVDIKDDMSSKLKCARNEETTRRYKANSGTRLLDCAVRRRIQFENLHALRQVLISAFSREKNHRKTNS